MDRIEWAVWIFMLTCAAVAVVLFAIMIVGWL